MLVFTFKYFNVKILLNRALSYIALFVFLINFSLANIPELDSKFIWILRDSLTSPEKIQKALIYASEAGYNKVFIQIRGRGYAFYNSKIVPKNPLVDNSFDPLKYAIEISKKLDIELHVWFNTYILWSSSYEPKDLNHVYHLKKEGY